MKKKAAVFVAMISVCLIATAGIGAITAASDEPAGDVVITVYKINQANPEAPPIPIKTFDGRGPMSVTVIGNEYDDSANIIKEDKEGITEYTFEDDTLTITSMQPSKRIDASGTRTYYEASTYNHRIPYECSVQSSALCWSAGAESCDHWARCWSNYCC